MADVTATLLRSGFVETVFHCPACGLAGTSLSRPATLLGRTCLDCDAPVVTSVLDPAPEDVCPVLVHLVRGVASLPAGMLAGP